MIEQYVPKFNREELAKEVSDYILTDGRFTEFKHTEQFQNEIKEFLQVKYCFTIPNGTFTLCIALLVNGIKPGDFVLVPNISMIATVNAVKFIGANPILIDIDARNGCMNLQQAVQFINLFNIKSVIYVTLNGRCHKTQEYIEFQYFCNKNKVSIIEDNAQSFGSVTNDGKMISCPYTSDGIGSFSFSMPKIITTGQGGCLVTNNDKLAEKIKTLRDFGRTEGGIDVHDEFGINCKFTEIASIIGKNQLKNIKWRVQRKKEIYDLYEQELNGRCGISMIYREYNLTPWFVDIYVEHRKNLIGHLKANNIQTRPMYQPINSQKIYDEYEKFNYPISVYYGFQGLWLPSSLDLTNNEIKMISEKVRQFYGE